MLIIMIRIEADVYFSRKFINLFKNKENKKKSMDLINEIITEIYDKHGYMNSFVTVAGKSKELKEKMNKNLLPRFKNKLFATSNFLEQIFNNNSSDILMKKSEILSQENLNEIEQRKNFIMEQKVQFFSDFLNKINTNLSRRHLKPIFSIRNDNNNKFNNISVNSTMINVQRFKTPLNSIIYNNINNINDINDNNNIKKKNERYQIKNIRKSISNYDLSNKSTETKNTVFQSESKIIE